MNNEKDISEEIWDSLFKVGPPPIDEMEKSAEQVECKITEEERLLRFIFESAESTKSEDGREFFHMELLAKMTELLDRVCENLEYGEIYINIIMKSIHLINHIVMGKPAREEYVLDKIGSKHSNYISSLRKTCYVGWVQAANTNVLKVYYSIINSFAADKIKNMTSLNEKLSKVNTTCSEKDHIYALLPYYAECIESRVKYYDDKIVGYRNSIREFKNFENVLNHDSGEYEFTENDELFIIKKNQLIDNLSILPFVNGIEIDVELELEDGKKGIIDPGLVLKNKKVVEYILNEMESEINLDDVIAPVNKIMKLNELYNEFLVMLKNRILDKEINDEEDRKRDYMGADLSEEDKNVKMMAINPINFLTEITKATVDRYNKSKTKEKVKNKVPVKQINRQMTMF